MEYEKCKNCQYFLQHYTLCDNRLVEIYCGHCIYKTPKTKRPDRKACEHFVPGVSAAESFVRKEYLSKKLLDKVLYMELLPEIEELPI